MHLNGADPMIPSPPGFTCDEETFRVIEVTVMTLAVSGGATIIAGLIGIPLGIYLGMKRGRLFLVIMTLTHTFYGMPPVLAGLLFYLLLSRNGPLGSLGLIFTPAAMILVQVFLVTPIVIGLTASAVGSVEKSVLDTAITLGARGRTLLKTMAKEARTGILSAVMIAFGSAISEVGAVILVGGNIKWRTQVLTTAILIETEKGNIEYAVTLGCILLLLSVVTYSILTYIQARETGMKIRLRRKGSKPGRKRG